MGQEVFNELKAKGEIIESSPLYDQLQPIADAITRAAQPRYNHPFKFYLVHETQPNAFATPGGNVYVVDSLLYFVKNTDELAGTFVSRSISYHPSRHDDVDGGAGRRARREIGAAVLLGPSAAHVLAIALIGRLHSLRLFPRCGSARGHDRLRCVCRHRDTTLGDWCGCSRIFRMRTDGKCRSSCRTIPTIRTSDRRAGAAFPEESSGLREIQPGSEVGDADCRPQGRSGDFLAVESI